MYQSQLASLQVYQLRYTRLHASTLNPQAEPHTLNRTLGGTRPERLKKLKSIFLLTVGMIASLCVTI